MKQKPAPLFMMAQLPFNSEDPVALNTPMTGIMNDKGNLNVTLANFKELGILNHLLDKETSFIEIGCGRGYVLDYLYRRGKGNYYGIEPITSQYKIAIENLKKLNLPKLDLKKIKNVVKESVIEKANLKKEYYDYIYSYHVFEHLENPLVMLEYGRKWLKPNGKMIITCPNVEGYFPQKDLSKWRCAITSHRWLPGLSTIQRALSESGYEVKNFFTYGGFPAPRNWQKQLINRWVKWKNLGDVMCVMAVKKS